jgi:hypothetical protein
MKRELVVCLATALFIMDKIGLVQAAPVITSTFDSDSDGWMVTDFGNFSAQSTPTWSGGSIFTADVFNGITWSAPEKYLGNKMDFIGGTFSFDIKDSIADYAGGDSYYNLFLSSGDTILTHKGAYPTTPNQWMHDEASLSYQGWYYASGDWLTPVESVDFSAVLGHLEGIYITADWGWGISNVAWLDNVTMSTVPIPGALWLLVSGVASLAGLSMRRINR